MHNKPFLVLLPTYIPCHAHTAQQALSSSSYPRTHSFFRFFISPPFVLCSPSSSSYPRSQPFFRFFTCPPFLLCLITRCLSPFLLVSNNLFCTDCLLCAADDLNIFDCYGEYGGTYALCTSILKTMDNKPFLHLLPTRACSLSRTPTYVPF